MAKMSEKAKQVLLSEVLSEKERNEFYGYVVQDYGEAFDKGETHYVGDYDEIPKGYKGFVLHVNDHGNVTLYMRYKNGNLREIASRV